MENRKALYIRKGLIHAKLLGLNNVCQYMNELHNLLIDFGINNYKAVYNSDDEVNQFIRSKMNNLDIPFNKFLNLINKEKEYKAIIHLQSKISGYKYFHLIEYSDNSFKVALNAEKTFRELLTPYITNPKEIELVTRIENLIVEAISIGNILGINIARTDLLKTFRAYQENGKISISPGDFLKRIN